MFYRKEKGVKDHSQGNWNEVFKKEGRGEIQCTLENSALGRTGIILSCVAEVKAEYLGAGVGRMEHFLVGRSDGFLDPFDICVQEFKVS